MASGQSSVAVDVHDDGFISPAVAVSPGLEPDDVEQSSIDGVFPFTKLPIELQNKIVGHAMTAVDHEIVFPCLTDADYAPDIAVGLLSVNHRIYHEAQFQLRKQNRFTFGDCGSDLKQVASSVGLLKCRSGTCEFGPLCLTLANVKFILGDEGLPGSGADKIHSFGIALRYLRHDMFISSLHIKLAYFSFPNSEQLSAFASTLSNIKVQEKLFIGGDEQILDMSFGDIPKNLGMGMMPVCSRFEAYNPNIRYSPGAFSHEYLPARYFDQYADFQHGHLIVGPTNLSLSEEAIGAQLTG